WKIPKLPEWISAPWCGCSARNRISPNASRRIFGAWVRQDLPRSPSPQHRRHRPASKHARSPGMQGALRLSNPASVDDRTGVVLEPLAQVDELRVVGQEVPVIIHHLVGEDR